MLLATQAGRGVPGARGVVVGGHPVQEADRDVADLGVADLVEHRTVRVVEDLAGRALVVVHDGHDHLRVGGGRPPVLADELLQGRVGSRRRAVRGTGIGGRLRRRCGGGPGGLVVVAGPDDESDDQGDHEHDGGRDARADEQVAAAGRRPPGRRVRVTRVARWQVAGGRGPGLGVAGLGIPGPGRSGRRRTGCRVAGLRVAGSRMRGSRVSGLPVRRLRGRGRSGSRRRSRGLGLVAGRIAARILGYRVEDTEARARRCRGVASTSGSRRGTCLAVSVPLATAQYISLTCIDDSEMRQLRVSPNSVTLAIGLRGGNSGRPCSSHAGFGEIPGVPRLVILIMIVS